MPPLPWGGALTRTMIDGRLRTGHATRKAVFSPNMIAT